MTAVAATTGKLSLPLIAASTNKEAAPSWEGWTPLAAPAISATAFDGAEPFVPQGAYSQHEPETPLSVPLVTGQAVRPAELLAPAGGIDAAFAAFHFGADAIYLGLKKFSARAEAENFTLEELDEVTAYAHSLTPRRRVFVTINTLIRQDELPELIEALVGLEAIGVDAVILQDLGVYRALRQYFPKLELHASTQMAVHNRAGAEVLRDMGFARVVLARELTFEEVHDITRAAGVETEVFIHGALCYSYSGLCLFSAQTLGRSGNRGKCAYSCRDSFEVTGAPTTLRDGTSVKRDPQTGFPFSMKDLALPDHMPALRAAGISCFKIEGRKKSPLYVATTTDYYRRLLDGRLDPAERPDIEADLQTVFSRPWTRLFVQSHKDKEVADRDTVGHRGTPIGKVQAVTRIQDGRQGTHTRLRFRTSRPLEKHDGLQIDLPVLGKPFGFAVDQLWIVPEGSRSRSGASAKPQAAITAAAGSVVEVSLPHDHPHIPGGAPVYCSSSQEVKQRYRHERPKPGLHRTRQALAIEAMLGADGLHVVGRAGGRTCAVAAPGPFPPARDLAAIEIAARSAFERLGDSRFELADFTWTNQSGGFVPLSKLNSLRRELIAKLEAAQGEGSVERIERLRAEVCPTVAATPSKGADFRWSIKVDRIGFLEALEPPDWDGVDEAVIDIARDHPGMLRERLDHLSGTIGRERIRLALPAVSRAWEEKGLRQKIASLRAAGWDRWEAANLSAWSYLAEESHPALAVGSRLNMATDWSVYVLNRLAARQLIDMGVSRFCLSPEDGLANARSLLAEFAAKAVVIVHQDTPLFLAESCAYANLIGGCPGKANCSFESMDMVSSHGEKVTAIDYHCRTIVLNQGPFCLSTRLKDLRRALAVNLRADFVYRTYEATEVRDRWRLVRAGKVVPGGHCANIDREIL